MEMKKTLFFCALITSLFALSCKKKKIQEEDLPNYTMGSITGLRVGDTLLPKVNMNLTIVAIRSKVSGCPYNDNYTLDINHKAKTNEYNEGIIISNISPEKTGVQKVFSLQPTNCDTLIDAAMYIGGSDFVLYRYYPAKNANNTITLSGYNATTKEVSGTFDITFANFWGTPESRKIYPDTIRLHQCEFKAIINE